MIQEFFKDSSKHEYPILISSASARKGSSEIIYCIRKHQAEEFFSLTVVCVDGDRIDTWSEQFLSSIAQAQGLIDEILHRIEQRRLFKTAFSNALKRSDNVLHVTPNLTILYLDADNCLRISSREDNVFIMPGFYPSAEILNLFNRTGGELRV